MTRGGLGYLNQLGGHQDDRGFYQRPFPSQEAFGQQLQPGTWEFPMDWDPRQSILLEIDGNGMIYRQDYRLQQSAP